jgi:hypothetical protein
MSWAEMHPSRKNPVKIFPLIDEITGCVDQETIPPVARERQRPVLREFIEMTGEGLDASTRFSELPEQWHGFWSDSERPELAVLAAESHRIFNDALPRRKDMLMRLQVTYEREEATVAPGNVVSYSQISTWERCPRLFFLRYVAGVPPRPTDRWMTQLGTAFHDALHAAHLASDYSRTHFQEAFRGALSADGEASGSDAAVRILDGFFASGDSTHTPLAVEQEFFINLSGQPGGTLIHGFIDRIQQHADGTVEIVDYKTYRVALTREQVAADLQLPIYVLASQRCLPWSADLATMAFVRHGQWERFRVSELDIDRAVTRIEHAIAGIRAGEHACTCGGEHCRQF